MHDSASPLLMLSRAITAALLLLLLSGLLGCATISGTKQIVSVDSQPRGATVYQAGDPKPLGKTPFFYPMPRSAGQTLQFIFPGGPPVELTISCRYRWLIEGLGNGATVLFSPPAALGGLVLDFVTGAAFNCGPVVKAQGYGVQAPGHLAYCKRYLVAPPIHSDEEISDRITAIWVKKVTPRLRGCDEIISDAVAKNAWDYVNIDNTQRLDRYRFGREKLNQVGHDTGATHLVILDYRVLGDRIFIDPEVIDLHSFVNDDAEPFKVVSGGETGLELSAPSKALAYSFSLLPNAVTLGRSFDTAADEATAGYRLNSQQNETPPPLWKGGFGLTSIDHPSGFGDWDFVADLYPSLGIVYFRQDINYSNGNQAASQTKGLDLFYLLPLYHGGVTVHTPLGAFAADVGFGVSAYRVTLSGFRRDLGMRPVGSTGITYTGFVSQNVFVQFGSVSYAFTPGDFTSGPVGVKPQIFEAYAQAGYFLPDFRHRARRLFGNL